jgi:hypothetical protein
MLHGQLLLVAWLGATGTAGKQPAACSAGARSVELQLRSTQALLQLRISHGCERASALLGLVAVADDS